MHKERLFLVPVRFGPERPLEAPQPRQPLTNPTPGLARRSASQKSARKRKSPHQHYLVEQPSIQPGYRVLRCRLKVS